MHQTIRTLVRPLALSLAAALAFVAVAQVDVRFGIFDGERLVGKGELEIDADERKLEIELLAGYEGVVRLTLPTADGGTVEYVGTVGPDGLKLLGFPDLAAFAAVLGDGVTVLVTYDDSIHPDELAGDDDAGREEDDDASGGEDGRRDDDDANGDDDSSGDDDGDDEDDDDHDDDDHDDDDGDDDGDDDDGDA